MDDIRYAVRTLLRSPGYTLIALLTLVLGLGANTAVFSLVNGVLLAPLPYPDPADLVVVREVNGRGSEMDAAWKNFTDWRSRTDAFTNLVAYSAGEATVLGAAQPVRVGVAAVSDGFFEALGVVPVRGRPLQPQDHRFGAPPALVVSHKFWEAQLARSDDALLSVAGHDAQVVGVMPPGRDFPDDVDVWYPVELERLGDSRTSHNFDVLGRLRPGVPLERADADLDAITLGFRTEIAGFENEPGALDYFPHEASVVSLHEATIGNMRRPLTIMLGASLLLLLVACTNLASTTLARGTAREREYAVRHALGASRGRLVRLQFVEALVLSLTGAVLGFALGALALRLLPVLAPAGLPRIDEITLDPGAALFTLGLAFFAATIAGLWPGLRASRRAAAALRSGARTGAGQRSQRVWRLLVGAEVALALLLLVGSGLLLRSFWTVLRVEPGYRMSGVLTATLDPPESRYADGDARRDYYNEVFTALQRIPGVEHVGFASAGPLEGVSNGLLQVRGGPAEDLSAEYQIASDGYFEALGISLQRGRLFDERDRANSVQVAVVSRAFAEQAWPGDDPIGKEVSSGGMEDSTRWATVIGVVDDVRQVDLTRDPRPTVFTSYRQRPFRTWSMTAVLQPVNGDAVALIRPVRQVVTAIDDNVPVRFSTIEQRLSDALTPRRFILLVILAFSGVALLLASVGVYGVVSYAVERRRREIGIRLALGAQPRSVRRTVQRDYLIAAAIGTAVGTLAALALTRVLESMLYEVQPTDPLTFAAVIALLAATAWVASFIPALRTTRVDPLETMKAE
ncbi:MAG: ABC transporter permease [Longimicrobiales bacterium]